MAICFWTVAFTRTLENLNSFLIRPGNFRLMKLFVLFLYLVSIFTALIMYAEQPYFYQNWGIYSKKTRIELIHSIIMELHHISRCKLLKDIFDGIFFANGRVV